MKPRTFGVAVTDMGARSYVARHVPNESARHTGLFAWISQTSSRLRSIDVRDFLTAAATSRPRPGRRSRMQSWAARQLTKRARIAPDRLPFRALAATSFNVKKQHGSAANDKMEPGGRLLFTFLRGVSGLRQTSSRRHRTLVLSEPQSAKLSAHCTCHVARLWSARVATFLLR